jgi:hypothetical protein
MSTFLNLINAFQEVRCPQAVLHLLEVGEFAWALCCTLLLQLATVATVPQYLEDFLGVTASRDNKIATLEESCD